MLPLVGDLAPPARRATALSIVVSGLLGGILIARLLSGIITQYSSWRTVYWFSFGVQYLILILLYFFMPDYPSTNPGGLNYFKMLWSIVRMVGRYPLLAQACVVGFMTSTIFTNYWTTLTFLLSEPPYKYSSVVIGLFALIGISAMIIGPFYVSINHAIPRLPQDEVLIIYTVQGYHRSLPPTTLRHSWSDLLPYRHGNRNIYRHVYNCWPHHQRLPNRHWHSNLSNRQPHRHLLY